VIDCAECTQLIGHAATIEPHRGLRPQSGRKLPYGWHEIYKCELCGDILERRLLQPENLGKDERWARVRTAAG
jgi:hypothetical protein